MKTCEFKHTDVQVSDDEWVCPNCGVGLEASKGEDGWIIVDSPNLECEKLHVNDELECCACGKVMSGAEYAEWLKNKGELIECPCCKGKGVVKMGSSNK